MSETRNKFYLTTPIYYVNARPHIGHAYSTIAADVIARRHRLLGDDTFFLTGTDEHGQKIQRAALAAGVPPQQYADQVSATFRDLWKRMGITNDNYIRTTDARHVEGVQKLWRELEARGAIYLSTYTGQYSVGEEMFVEGPPGTIGPDGKPTETVTEENYYFRLSRFQRPLIELIESEAFVIEPEARRNEILSFLRGNVVAASRQGDQYQEDIPPALDELREIELREIFEKALMRVQETGEPFSFDAMVSNERYFLHVLAWKYAGLMTRSKGSDPHRAVVLYKRDATPVEGRSGGQEIEYSARGNPYVVGALNDLSISRSSFDWGVAVPNDPKHVIYVWLDALANYMTAVGYGSDDPAEQAKFERYWPADLHLVGKEITRFHCVYWPAFLLAAGLPLPKSVVANGWLLFEESKMSKSRGNVVRTETILDAFGPLCPPVPAGESSGLQPAESAASKGTGFSPSVTNAQRNAALAAEVQPSEPLRPPTKAEQDLFAADILRYYLLREIPFGQDGSFSFDALITRYNADLANGYGNLVSRTLAMINTSFGGEIPEAEVHRSEGQSELNVALRMRMLQITKAFEDEEDSYNFTNYLAQVSGLIAATDAYLTAEAPWKLAKLDDEESQRRLKRVLLIAASSIQLATKYLYPVMPYATASVWRQLGLGSIEDAARNGELKNLQWGGLKPGTKLGPLAPIFPRADKGLAQIMTDMESPATPARTPTESVKSAVSPSPAPSTESVASGSSALNSPPTPASETIGIDDFAKVDLRVAQIVVAERIPKADKLLRLEVDLGPNFNPSRRQILAGIAEYYAPETLIGRKVVIVANLAPRKMRGLESNGMIVAASIGPAGAPVLAGFLEDVELGARLK